jgi:predicted MPP superfamily phosphohydrolase
LLTRRRFLRACAAGAGLAGGAVLYTWRVEPHWLEVVERPLPLAHLPKALAGTRLVQLSDLHIGPRVDDAFLVRAFGAVSARGPEIVVYTGDFISYDADFAGHARRLFERLPRGRWGTFGILGNHDYGPRWAHPEVAADLADLAGEAGVRILRNETASVRGLQIAGLDDLWAHRFDPGPALSALTPEQPALVLSHNPDTADSGDWGAYAGWILAGHTHGGQCKPPFLPPPLLPVRNRRYTAGEFKLAAGRRLYINRGLGHLLRVRFNVRPEIAVFRLEPESASGQ